MDKKIAVVKVLIVGFLSLLFSDLKAQAGDNLPVLHFQKIHDAIVNGDAGLFASLVKYPVLRDYPLKNIEDSAQMVAYFPVLIDDSLRNAFKDVKPEDWKGGGWRGYTDGNFWDDGTGIYSIDYYSKAELNRKAELEREEIESLHPSLRQKNIEPITCLYDSAAHVVLRLDKIVGDDDIHNKYRVCVYKDVGKLRSEPDLILDASPDDEGTAGIRWMECYQQKSRRRIHVMDFAIDYTDSPDGFEANVLKGKGKGKHRLYSAYWLDLVK